MVVPYEWKKPAVPCRPGVLAALSEYSFRTDSLVHVLPLCRGHHAFNLLFGKHCCMITAAISGHLFSRLYRPPHWSHTIRTSIQYLLRVFHRGHIGNCSLQSAMKDRNYILLVELNRYSFLWPATNFFFGEFKNGTSTHLNSKAIVMIVLKENNTMVKKCTDKLRLEIKSV